MENLCELIVDIPLEAVLLRLCNVLTSTGWYFDSVSRDEATRVLSDKSVGSFLVRRTEENRKQHVNVSNPLFNHW